MKISGHKFMGGLLGIALATGLVAGCKSSSPSQYVSPRVEGRVVDAQTHQPIRNATISRINPGQAPVQDANPKGAMLLEQAPAIRSGADGRFVLDSERDLAFFRTLGWYSITLRFEHNGYASQTISYSLADATNTPSGEPLVKTGDILLTPQVR